MATAIELVWTGSGSTGGVMRVGMAPAYAPRAEVQIAAPDLLCGGGWVWPAFPCN